MGSVIALKLEFKKEHKRLFSVYVQVILRIHVWVERDFSRKRIEKKIMPVMEFISNVE